MPRPSTTQKTDAETRVGQQLDKVCQVVLFNDEVNSMEYVVLCLMRVFGHPLAIAAKVMFEAHTRGKAIAEVESEAAARKHQQQLHAHGLTATVESI